MEGFSRWRRIGLPCLLLLLVVAEGLLELLPQMSVQSESGVSVESERGRGCNFLLVLEVRQPVAQAAYMNRSKMRDLMSLQIY